MQTDLQSFLCACVPKKDQTNVLLKKKKRSTNHIRNSNADWGWQRGKHRQREKRKTSERTEKQTYNRQKHTKVETSVAAQKKKVLWYNRWGSEYCCIVFLASAFIKWICACCVGWQCWIIYFRVCCDFHPDELKTCEIFSCSMNCS